MTAETRSVIERLNQSDSWRVWVVEYGLTHSVLSLGLSTREYPPEWRLQCIGCIRLEVSVVSGPHRLEIVAAGAQGLCLRSEDKSLRVVCDRVVLDDTR